MKQATHITVYEQSGVRVLFDRLEYVIEVCDLSDYDNRDIWSAQGEDESQMKAFLSEIEEFIKGFDVESYDDSSFAYDAIEKEISKIVSKPLAEKGVK
jgi:hypothetical protein